MISLQSLALSCYSQVNQFNIPRLLENVLSLRALQLKAFEVHPHSHPSSTVDNVHVPQSMVPPVQHDCDFKREMEGPMPSKLSEIQFSGSGIRNLADNLFSVRMRMEDHSIKIMLVNVFYLQGIQSSYLRVIFANTSISTLPKNLFARLGQVKNVSLDFSRNNNQLKTVPNPNTASVIHLPEKVFLTSLRMGANDQLDCDCALGWVEFWNRKKRQFVCSAQTWSADLFGTQFYDVHRDEKQQEICEDTEHGLRQAKCSNKRDVNLVEVLKADLECGWGSGAILQKASLILVLSLLFVLWF